LSYSIDTSAIIDGRRRYYPADVFPGLWQKVEALIVVGELIATEEVWNELSVFDDEVFAWARAQSRMFIPLDGDTQMAVTSILHSHAGLVDPLGLKSRADPFVIALAQIAGASVITGEKPNNNPLKPKIPNVCQALGIRVMNFLDFIRDQGWKF
jgi:hypothetical protein